MTRTSRSGPQDHDLLGGAHPLGGNVSPGKQRTLLLLAADLQACRLDEIAHRDEASSAGPSGRGWLARIWATTVAIGSMAGVAIARRI